MKITQVLKKWWLCGCVLYTLIAVGFLVIGFLTDNTNISISQFLLILPCSLTISVGMQIYGNQKLSKGTRYMSNYAFTVFGAFLFLILPAGTASTQMANFLMFLLLSLVYWIIFLLYLLVVTHIYKLKNM